MMLRTLFAGALLALVSVVRIPAAEVKLDIPYGGAGDTEAARRLDLRAPDGHGPFPVVILVHGGGWSSGDKAGAEKPNSGADITPWFAPLTDASFLVVSINYRLAPAHRWPACLEDTRTALRWVQTHVADYGGDPARMAIMGHSAGGHLALLAAMPVDGVASPVVAVVGCAAVSDLVSDTERRGGASASLQGLFAIPAELNPATRRILADRSPLYLVGAGYPPTLLLHGEADKTVPFAQSQAFQNRLRELGSSCDLHALPGAGHRLTEWLGRDPVWTKILTDWLQARLARTSQTAPDTAK